MTPLHRTAATERFAPVLRRLATLTPLDGDARRALAVAFEGASRAPPRRELMAERRAIARPLLLLEGWAARVRLLADGRRQFVCFFLPGDAIGWSGYDGAPATCTVAALTAVTTCPLPTRATSPALDRALAVGDSLDQGYLVAQVTRLGRLNARERILDFVLELYDRLRCAGLADAGGMDVPLTQEVLADALGLTSVHVNRMLQQLRRSGDLEWTGQHVRISDLDQARRIAGGLDQAAPGTRVAI